jgi:hypothetical protein
MATVNQLIAQVPVDAWRIAFAKGNVDGDQFRVRLLESADAGQNLSVQRGCGLVLRISLRTDIYVRDVDSARSFEQLGLKSPDRKVDRRQEAHARQHKHHNHRDRGVPEPFGGEERVGSGFQKAQSCAPADNRTS